MGDRGDILRVINWQQLGDILGYECFRRGSIPKKLQWKIDLLEMVLGFWLDMVGGLRVVNKKDD